MLDEKEGKSFVMVAREAYEILGLSPVRWLWVDGEGVLTVAPNRHAFLFGMDDAGHVSAIRTILANVDQITEGDYSKFDRLRDIVDKLTTDMYLMGHRPVDISRPLGSA